MKCLVVLTLLTGLSFSAGGNRPPVPPYETKASLDTRNPVDKLVFAALKRAGAKPAYLCSDPVFLRRVYLDVTGTLPTPKEVREFLADRTPGKRTALVDRLLRRKEFADYWAMKWCDILRVKSEFPINLWPNAVQAYYRWIRTSIRENLPYDRFARALLTQSGSNFRTPPVNFYRALQDKSPETLARGVALTFMGARAKKWPKERLSSLAAFFRYVGFKSTREWKEEIVYFDSVKAAEDLARGVSMRTTFPDGTPATLSPEKDPRELFADWLISPRNPWFNRAIVNRIWFWLLGRGIIHEPDDIRPDNPPSNPELLRFLEKELVKSKYDLRHIYRLILTSKTYQLSFIPRDKNPRARELFAFYPLRRLDAEVLIDALCEITGTTESYSSRIPEPFTFIPEDHRSIALPDGSITSSFLELFGRPSRDSGLAAERNNQPSAAQRLHFLNSSHVLNKIRKSRKLRRLFQISRKPDPIFRNIYLAVLSRFPTREELNRVREYQRSKVARGWETYFDLTWALMNSMEFQYRH